MKLKVLDINGNKSDTLQISDKLLNIKVNHKFIKYVIDWQLNHLKPEQLKQNKEMRLRDQQKK